MTDLRQGSRGSGWKRSNNEKSIREESQTHIAKSLSNASTLDDAGSEYEEEEDDDEDELKVIAKPFHFQTPYPKFLGNADREANSIGSKINCDIYLIMCPSR